MKGLLLITEPPHQEQQYMVVDFGRKCLLDSRMNYSHQGQMSSSQLEQTGSAKCALNATAMTQYTMQLREKTESPAV